MKIKIFEKQEVETEIEIEFPYYYKVDLMPDDDDQDDILYGKIYIENLPMQFAKHWSIQEKDLHLGNERRYEITCETYCDLESQRHMHCCFAEIYKSNESEYLKAKERAFKFFKRA